MRDAGRTASESNPAAPCPNRAGSVGRNEGERVSEQGQVKLTRSRGNSTRAAPGLVAGARGRSLVSLGCKYSNQVYSVLMEFEDGMFENATRVLRSVRPFPSLSLCVSSSDQRWWSRGAGRCSRGPALGMRASDSEVWLLKAKGRQSSL
jgi:hypothetical protein